MKLFWNKKESRLTAGLRIFLTIVVIVAMGRLMTFLNREFLSLPRGEEMSSIVTALMITISVLISIKIFDKRKFRNLGFEFNSAWGKEFAFGMGMGLVLMGVVFLFEYLLGWIEITGSFVSDGVFIDGFLLSLAGYIAVGYWEELVMRGYLIKNISEGLTTKRINSDKAVIYAVISTSFLFGAVHLANPNFSVYSLIEISFVGILLALPFILTGRLAMSIGLHISWNFAQGPIFGFPVSGITNQPGTVFQINQLGSDIFTGGEFGPEAGILGIVITVLGILLVYLYFKKSKKLKINKSIASYKK